MTQSAEKILFENDRVRVLRCHSGPRANDLAAARHDRLIVYLNDGHIARSQDGAREDIRRSAGEVVWRDRSRHRIENLGDADHEVIIIELKA